MCCYLLACRCRGVLVLLDEVDLMTKSMCYCLWCCLFVLLVLVVEDVLEVVRCCCLLCLTGCAACATG